MSTNRDVNVPALNKVIGILGDRGSFKSCFATSLAYSYAKNGLDIFTNMEFQGFKHKIITIKDIVSFPDWLKDGVIIIDEIHVWADAYAFLMKDVQAFTKFITQIRKRNLTFIFITQDYRSVVRRLRRQTDFMFLMSRSAKEGYANIEVRDVKNHYTIVNKIVDFYGVPYFKMYNTNQIHE